MSEVRTGLGWDLHRLAPGRPLILGGVTVPSERGLEGHSDADVLSHAITDAVLGAAALGDIGMHFPDSDPRWKGANSLVFLRHALELAAERGFRLVNVDATVTLERPKLKDYRQAIPESLATAKLQTNQLEAELAGGSGYPEPRPLNLDPGLLTLGKFMLATTKDQAHRIYLQKGIFAEVTLRYQAGAFEPWPWTYADYRQPIVLAFLNEARDYYRQRLRQGCGEG